MITTFYDEAARMFYLPKWTYICGKKSDSFLLCSSFWSFSRFMNIGVEEGKKNHVSLLHVSLLHWGGNDSSFRLSHVYWMTKECKQPSSMMKCNRGIKDDCQGKEMLSGTLWEPSSLLLLLLEICFTFVLDLEGFDSVVSSTEKLSHPTTSRPKATGRRPPSQSLTSVSVFSLLYGSIARNIRNSSSGL